MAQAQLLTCPDHSQIARRTHTEEPSRLARGQPLRHDALEATLIDSKSWTPDVLTLISSASEASLHAFYE